MPFAFKLLKAAVLASGANVNWYRVGTTGSGAATSAIVSNVRFYNTNTSGTVNVDLYIRKVTGVNPQIRLATQYGLSATSSAVYNTEMTLEKDAVIEVTTSGTGVNCVISGVERL